VIHHRCEFDEIEDQVLKFKINMNFIIVIVTHCYYLFNISGMERFLVRNCPTTQDAIKLLLNDKHHLKITFMINENFNFVPSELEKFMKFDKNVAILLNFHSTCENSSIVYWKLMDSDKILSIKSTSEIVEFIICNVLLKSIESNHSGEKYKIY
jgi:hypothetical protein